MSSVFYVIISIDNIIAISELLAAVAWLSNCARKNSRDSIWAAYHKQLVAHLPLAGVPSPVTGCSVSHSKHRGRLHL